MRVVVEPTHAAGDVPAPPALLKLAALSGAAIVRALASTFVLLQRLEDPMRASLTALLLLAAPAFALQTAKVDPKRGAPVAALQRVAVLGASISAGMGLDPANPFAPEMNLSKVVEASLKGAHDPVLQQASVMFFMDPIGDSGRLMAAVKAAKPTLIVGVDYLFWFGYGSQMPNEADRLALLEKGLQTLEGLECPILLGDFPDMSLALKSPKPVLPPDALPPPATLKKLNERLHAWAAAHKNVILLPMAELTAQVVAGEEIRARDNLWPKGAMKALMQEDLLHTTLEGTTLLWIVGADRLLRSRKEIPAGALDLDARSILAKLDPKYPVAAQTTQGGKLSHAAAPPAKAPVPAGAGQTDPKKKDPPH
jgi:hypothetical protein